MLGLITALYVLFDPIITACNIAGNGAMAIIFDKMTKAFNGKDSLSA
jgi:Na+/H+-dicarboxylate symporter